MSSGAANWIGAAGEPAIKFRAGLEIIPGIAVSIGVETALGVGPACRPRVLTDGVRGVSTFVLTALARPIPGVCAAAEALNVRVTVESVDVGAEVDDVVVELREVVGEDDVEPVEEEGAEAEDEEVPRTVIVAEAVPTATGTPLSAILKVI